MEVSPYIHPPFKIVASRSDRLGVKDAVELHASDVSRSSWVFAVELRCEFCKGTTLVSLRFPGRVRII